MGDTSRVPLPDDTEPLTRSQQETWFAYMRLVLRLSYEMNRQLQVDNDLTLADYDVLNALADSPGHRAALSSLATRIGWERSRLSHHLLRMSRRGLVERTPSQQDGRVTDVVLSNTGRTRLQEATPAHAAFVRRMFFDGLDPQLLDPLQTALEQIHAQVLAEGTLPRPGQPQRHFADLPPST